MTTAQTVEKKPAIHLRRAAVVEDAAVLLHADVPMHSNGLNPTIIKVLHNIVTKCGYELTIVGTMPTQERRRFLYALRQAGMQNFNYRSLGRAGSATSESTFRKVLRKEKPIVCYAAQECLLDIVQEELENPYIPCGRFLVRDGLHHYTNEG